MPNRAVGGDQRAVLPLALEGVVDVDHHHDLAHLREIEDEIHQGSWESNEAKEAS